ncbi:MAG: universal stress protein [Vicinamibacterales bacterium]
MSLFSSVLCAVDASSLASRVFKHAVGLASLCGARLTVMTITPGDPHRAEAAVRSMMRAVVPIDARFLDDLHLRVINLAVGQPVDAILEEVRGGVDAVVVGTHARSGLSRWLLGSTSASLLREAPCPVLLVPPGELEVVTVDTQGATFHPGAVLAAVDLDERNGRQLLVARQLATATGAPLTLMTVAAAALPDDAAEAALRERAGEIPGDVALVVKRGDVPEAIDQAAHTAHAGVVVMGVRDWARGEPGHTARAVLKNKDAVVLAVPPA